jgi:RNase P subunit RPR2
MNDFKTLVCYNCKQIVANLSVQEVMKLKGVNFMCDCCGHLNMISSQKMDRGFNSDYSLNVFSIFG